MAAEGGKPSLTTSQASALFDILTHKETYAEIESHKKPEAIHNYGPPFQTSEVHSASPLLQTILSRFFCPLPGVRGFGQAFWSNEAESLLAELSAANLSEAFDKGDCGQRKTLATAMSALLEYLARGKFGGLPKKNITRTVDDYDLDDPNDLVEGFEDYLQGLVYGNLIDPLVERVAETDDLTGHNNMVQAAHRFILINVASFMHYTLIVSPKGPAILSLLDNAHRLIPYMIMRQTLKIGNVATMINGMLKIVLTKASVGAITNWLGISSGSDEGMNLLQTIIATVLGWESRTFKKRTSQIEKGKDGLDKEELGLLREYTKKSADEQEKYREQCRQNSKTLVSVILGSSEPLPPEKQKVAAEYLANWLSIEDRERITHVMCKLNPDLTTPMVRGVVSGYDPVIRRMHQAVDLSRALLDVENFLTDLIALAKPPSSKNNVEDLPDDRVPVSSFVRLCEKHQHGIHRFMHQLAKNGEELVLHYKSWINVVSAQCQITKDNPEPLRSLLEPLIAKLSAEDREAVMKEIDAYAVYLARLSSSSNDRARALVAAAAGDKSEAQNGESTSNAGPGMFLAKWQALLDNTEIGPTEDGIKTAADARVASERGVEKETEQAPAVTRTLELLIVPFRDAVREISEAENWKI